MGMNEELLNDLVYMSDGVGKTCEVNMGLGSDSRRLDRYKETLSG